MQFQDFYPLIVTDKLSQCRDFYTRWFTLEIGFESSWFLWLHSSNESISLAFMHPDHPSAPPRPESFNGKGMCLEFQVEDAQATYDQLLREGLDIAYSIRDEPFGQRRFGLHDPASVWIDVVQQIEPMRGWWDKYMLSS